MEIHLLTSKIRWGRAAKLAARPHKGVRDMNLSSTNVEGPGTVRPTVGPRSTKRNASAVRARKLAPFAFVSPTLALITLLTVVPILMVAGYSFMDNVIVEPNPVFVGFANYV